MSADPPVGVGCNLGGVVFEALAVLLYGFLMLPFLYQSIAFLFQGLAFLQVFIAGSWQEERRVGKKNTVKEEKKMDFCYI